ncbi:MAG: GNAT family N-acetyltransferase [Steroidobacteraceae bacterium]
MTDDGLLTWPIVALASAHDRRQFDCGADALNRYLKELATQDQRRRVAACFVIADPQTNVVAGYYTLSAFTVGATDIPPDLARKLPKYGQIPCTLLGRLAVDRGWGGRGAGALLLVDALRRALLHAAEIASWAVIVDAKDEAAFRFYARHGFLPLPDTPCRQFLPMATIAALFP